MSYHHVFAHCTCYACVVIDCYFPVFYALIDQVVGVPPQYPDDPYHQPAKQGKRNPPSEHVSSYVFANYFLHYNIAFGSKCLCLD